MTADRIYRFVDGLDSCLTAMSETDIQDTLNDEFASGVLRNGVFPDSVDHITQALTEAFPEHIRSSYLVGEGGQVPLSIASRDAVRNLRYVVSWGPQSTSGRTFLSAAPGGQSSFHQVISWDDTAKKFDFFEYRTQIRADPSTPRVWSWAGASPMARQSGSTGRGCFDCHHNGVVIMKELQSPWNNWHSEVVNIPAEHVPEAVAVEPLFQERKGAQELQTTVQNGAQSYYRAWLRARVRRGNPVALRNVDEMLRHLVVNTTVNFEASQMQTRTPSAGSEGTITGIPSNTYLWDSVLGTLLQLDYSIPHVEFDRDAFSAFLDEHRYALVQSDAPEGETYQEPGSTFFFFFVPVPAFEDQFIISQLRSTGIVSDKFIAAVLMVDFTNPVFSETRPRLERYASAVETGTIADGMSSVPVDFAAQVEVGSRGQPDCDRAQLDRCTAEQQFLYYWRLADTEWRTEVQQRLQDYLDEIGGLSSEERLRRLMQLGADRRTRFQTWPMIENLDEFSLLIPENDLAQP